MEQWQVDRDFEGLVCSIKADQTDAGERLVTDDMREEKVLMLKGAIGGFVVVLVAATQLLRTNVPWWITAGFVIYAGPGAALVSLTVISRLSARLRGRGRVPAQASADPDQSVAVEVPHSQPAASPQATDGEASLGRTG